jgi:hypothetical protein
MSTAYQGGPTGRRSLPRSPGESDGGAYRDRGTGRTPAPAGQAPPPLDRPGRPRLDGWVGPPPQPSAENGHGRQADARRRWLLAAALGVVVSLGVATLVLVTRPGGEAPGEVGTVRTASGARVRTSGGAEPRALKDGEVVLTGWSVEAGDGPAVTVDLAAGGVLRFDGGATLTFAEADGSGESKPSVEIVGGRTWFNPGGVPESAALVLRTEVVTLRSTGNPVALDCTIDCTVEAPAGGVKVSADDGVNVAPVSDEALTVTSDGGLVMRTIDQPSAWAQENLDADAAALPPPDPALVDGVTAGALPAGAYALDLAITNDGEGAALPAGVMFRRGQTAHYDATVETGSCPQVPCDVPVAATSARLNTTVRLAGSFHIENRSMALTLTRPIDCPVPDPDRAPGTVTITVNMTVSEAAYDESARRWIATVMGGPGTSTAEIGDASCLGFPGGAGARTTALEMTGHAAG